MILQGVDIVFRGGTWCYMVLTYYYRLLHGVDIVLQGVTRWYMVLQALEIVLQAVAVLTECFRVLHSVLLC